MDWTTPSSYWTTGKSWHVAGLQMVKQVNLLWYSLNYHWNNFFLRLGSGSVSNRSGQLTRVDLGSNKASSLASHSDSSFALTGEICHAYNTLYTDCDCCFNDRRG